MLELDLGKEFADADWANGYPEDSCGCTRDEVNLTPMGSILTEFFMLIDEEVPPRTPLAPCPLLNSLEMAERGGRIEPMLLMTPSLDDNLYDMLEDHCEPSPPTAILLDSLLEVSLFIDVLSEDLEASLL